MPRHQWTLNRTLAVILTVATLLGMLCALVIDRTVQAQQLHEIDEEVVDHEGRLRVIEQRLDQIAVDVRWIRSGLDERWGREVVAR